MKIQGKHYRTIWIDPDNSKIVQIIDQRFLPFQLEIESLDSVNKVADAIAEMQVRGAGLIGASAGYGMYLAALEGIETSDFNGHLQLCARRLIETRPTAVNLAWAVQRQLDALSPLSSDDEKVRVARETAQEIADEDADWCRRIGLHGLELIRRIARGKAGQPVNILTHCNAGWLAFVDYG